MRVKNPYLASFFILLGIIIFLNPFKTLEFLLSIVAFGILLYGINNILSYRIFNKPYLITQGIVNIVFSLILLFSLSFAVKTVAFIIGIYILVMGVMRFINSLRLKRYNIVGSEKQTLSSLILIVIGLYVAIFPSIFPMAVGLILISIGISMVRFK